MGSSYTEFNRYGFWARDPSLEVWLFLLADEIARTSDPVPAWLREAQDHWLTQARVGLIGCIDAGLDEILTNEDRVIDAVAVAEAALARLRSRGQLLSRDYLNSLNVGGPGSTFTRDVETRHFTAVGEAFIALLCGRLTTDAATSPLV